MGNSTSLFFLSKAFNASPWLSSPVDSLFGANGLHADARKSVAPETTCDSCPSVESEAPPEKLALSATIVLFEAVSDSPDDEEVSDSATTIASEV